MNGTSEDPDLVVCFDTLGSEQSNYIEVAEGVIFMEYEFWADFRPVGNMYWKKRFLADY